MGNLIQIAKVGLGFKNIGLDNIKFITVPFQYSTAQPGRVEFLPEAEQLWQRVIDDEPLSRRLSDDVITAGDDVEGGESPSSERQPERRPRRRRDTEDEAAAREQAGLCA